MSCSITNGIKSITIEDYSFNKWKEKGYSYNINYAKENGSMSLEVKKEDDIIFYGPYPKAKESNDFIDSLCKEHWRNNQLEKLNIK